MVHFAYSLEVGRAGVQTIIISNSGNFEQEGQVRGIIKYVVVTNVCKKREKFNIRPVLSYQDSSGTWPEVPQGLEGQARPDLSLNFRFFRVSRVSPRPEEFWILDNF